MDTTIDYIINVTDMFYSRQVLVKNKSGAVRFRRILGANEL